MTLLVPLDELVPVRLPDNVPVVRLRAWPVPLSVISFVVRVPKLVPLILLPVVLPTLKPRRVLPVGPTTLTPFVAATVVVMLGNAPPVDGNVCPGPAVSPVNPASEMPAPWPRTFWLSRSVSGPR